MSCSTTAERRSNTEQQRHCSCVDHCAKFFSISLIAKVILDLIKTQTFWTAEIPTGFNENFVIKTIGSLTLLKLLLLKHSMLIFAML